MISQNLDLRLHLTSLIKQMETNSSNPAIRTTVVDSFSASSMRVPLAGAHHGAAVNVSDPSVDQRDTTGISDWDASPSPHTMPRLLTPLFTIRAVKVRPIDVATATYLLAGLLGLAFNSYYLYYPAAGWVRPVFADMWMNMFIAAYAFQLAIAASTKDQNSRGWNLACMVHCLLADTAAFLLMIGYFLGGGYRWRAGLWAIVLLTLLLLHTSLVSFRLRIAPVAQDPHSVVSVGAKTGLPAKTPSRCHQALWWTNTVLQSMGLVLLCMLLGGSWYEAWGWHTYPARGSSYTINYPSGQSQVINAWCTGTRNASLPTFWFEIGGGGHSMSDLWGLQFALNDAGRRVCTYDMPGTAWSDLPIANQPYITDQLMRAIGEPGPFILLGTMDSGPDRIYQYALLYPENVRALIPMGFGPPEFITYQHFYSLSNDQTLSYGKSQIEQRFQLCNVVRSIALQWGILTLLLPPPNYQPMSLASENQFLNTLNEKQWTTNCLYLANELLNPDTLLQPDLWSSNRSLSTSIPVIALYNNVSVAQSCGSSGYAPGSQECQLVAFTQNATAQFNEQMASMTPGSTTRVCQNCQGLLGQGDSLNWVLQNILELTADIEA